MKLLSQFNIHLEVVSAVLCRYSHETRWLCDSYFSNSLGEPINGSLVLGLGYLNEING